MVKKIRKRLWKGIVFSLVLLGAVFSLNLLGQLFVKKIQSISSDAVKIGSVSFSFPSVVMQKVDIYTPVFSLFLKELKVRPLFARKAFAFSGPGEILLREKRRDVLIKGSVSGNFKDKTIDIKKTSVEVDRLGSFEIKGLLEEWGKGSINAEMKLKGVEIDDIKQILGINLPFAGRVFGTAEFISDEKEKTRKVINFDLNIKDLAAEGSTHFESFIKGLYNIERESAEIYSGSVLSPDGGKVFFRGTADRENFNLNFETENMNIEEFLKLLPDELKEKYNLKIRGGTAALKDFSVIRVKKNCILTAACLLTCRTSLFPASV